MVNINILQKYIFELTHEAGDCHDDWWNINDPYTCGMLDSNWVMTNISTEFATNMINKNKSFIIFIDLYWFSLTSTYMKIN